MKEIIKIVPYNAEWPSLFEAESVEIKKALGSNCIDIHHVGSTAVPGLAAKPIIDIVPVVFDIAYVDRATTSMAALGYEARGEGGMLFRRFFKKRGFNVHVFEQTSAEVDGHLLFRDWLRTHTDDKKNYANLKQTLALRHPNDIHQYVFGKDAFVRNIHAKTGFKGIRVVQALTPREWDAVRHFRANLHTEEFDHPDHKHLVLYQGTEIIGYTHIQLCSDKAVIHLLAVDESKQNQNIQSTFLNVCERWLENLGFENIENESN